MRSLLSIVMLVVFLTGCVPGAVRRTFNGDIYRVDRPWYDSRTDRLEKEDLDEIQLDLATYCFPDQSDRAGTNEGRREATRSQRSDVSKRSVQLLGCKGGVIAYDLAVDSAAARDALQDKLLELSNRECSKHKAAVFGTNTGSNLILSTLASLLSGGATGFAAQTTKTALAAGSTFVIAAQSHFNEQVYRQMFVGTIIKAIEDDRTARLAEIYDNRRFPVPSTAPDPRVTGGVIGDQTGNARDEHIRHLRVADRESSESVTSGGRASSSSRNSTAEGPSSAPSALVTSGSTVAGQQPSGSTSPIVPPVPAAIQRQRLSYSVEEAIRDVDDYHDRCSFYNGLVRVAAAVQAFSPCEMLQSRRDRLLAELQAIRTAGQAQGAAVDRFTSFSAELKSIETKLQTCGQATAK